MKTKVIFFVGTVVMVFLLLSCEDQLDTAPKTISTLPDNGIPIGEKENYETMYMMQSNPELILADRIISKEAGFILDISKDEARELHISDEVYQKYVNRVNELNEQNIKK